MFGVEIRKIMYTPVNPSFTVQKCGLSGGGQNYIGMFSDVLLFMFSCLFPYFYFQCLEKAVYVSVAFPVYSHILL